MYLKKPKNKIEELELELMKKDVEIARLKKENMKLRIENERLKKGYIVKGVGAKKEYVTTLEKNTK